MKNFEKKNFEEVLRSSVQVALGHPPGSRPAQIG